MLPPVLEVYVLWHPGDTSGRDIAEEIVEHFHGSLFSGLIGGAIEVYVRSAGWRSSDDAPRPIPFTGTTLPTGMQPARFVAVVPVLGNELAAAIQQDGAWRAYIREVVAAREAERGRIGVFPFLLDRAAIDRTELAAMLSGIQRIAAPSGGGTTEPLASMRCRDLAQGITQLLMPGGEARLTVFISHTKRSSADEVESVEDLIRLVREVIGETRLQDFFDANDLQPGQDWDLELRRKAGSSALLSLRTDLYPSREWCQREVLIAKRHGMPMVVLDAIGRGEERGSFLMDHVPRVPARAAEGRWRKDDIRHGLNLLVDECLKRVLWQRQEELGDRELGFEIAWWAPHAPEPITLMKWLTDSRAGGGLDAGDGDLIILHPDPPLGADEKAVLQELAALAGINRKLDLMTPRLLAARSG